MSEVAEQELQESKQAAESVDTETAAPAAPAKDADEIDLPVVKPGDIYQQETHLVDEKKAREIAKQQAADLNEEEPAKKTSQTKAEGEPAEKLPGIDPKQMKEIGFEIIDLGLYGMGYMGLRQRMFTDEEWNRIKELNRERKPDPTEKEDKDLLKLWDSFLLKAEDFKLSTLERGLVGPTMESSFEHYNIRPTGLWAVLLILAVILVRRFNMIIKA